MIRPFFVTLTAICSVTAASPVRDLQRELKLNDTGWRVSQESETSIVWITPSATAVTLALLPGVSSKSLKSFDLAALRAAGRTEAKSRRGGLVEAEARILGGIGCNWVTMKFPLGNYQNPPDDRPGFVYHTSVVIPTAESRILLQAVAAETGATGMREAAGILIFMDENGLTDMEKAADSFTRDPYDHAYDQGAIFKESDDRRFDKTFPDHPLSKCRAQMERLLGSLTISERIQRIALLKASDTPSIGIKPATPANPTPSKN
jgi:hypothetical protein